MLRNVIDLVWMMGAGLGHVCLIVLAVNVVHGFGWRTRWIEPLTMLALAVVGLGTLVLGGWACWVGPSAWPEPLRWYAALGASVGLIGLPAVTWMRHKRRPPEGTWVETAALDLGTGDRAERFVGDGSHSGVLRWPGNESLRPEFVDVRAEVPGLPRTFEGLSIVHLTDLHLAPCFDRSYFEAVMDIAAELEPDLVLLTGDVVEHVDAVDWIEPVLGRVRGRLGSYAIVGNHDFRYGEEAVRAALAGAGYEDLDGRWTTIEIEPGRRLALGGTSAPWGPSLERSTMPMEADCRIVLSHTPDQFPVIAGWDGVDLLLCGHNHGGQVRMPVLGSVLVPSRYSRRYDMGLFQDGRTLMYVGRGLGAKHPLRWNCPPELTRLTLSAGRPARRARVRGAVRVVSG